MTRKDILEKIVEFEAVLAKGEKAVAHIVQWAWSHLKATGHVGSVITGDIRTRLMNLHTNAHSRMVAAPTPEKAPQAVPSPKAPAQGESMTTPPAPSQATPIASPDPNDKT